MTLESRVAGYEALNALIIRAQTMFESAELGVTASVCIGENHHVAFKKMGREWRLVLVTSDGPGLVEETVTLLTDTSIRLRMDAVAQLPALYEALVEQSRLRAGELLDLLSTTEVWLTQLANRIDADD